MSPTALKQQSGVFLNVPKSTTSPNSHYCTNKCSFPGWKTQVDLRRWALSTQHNPKAVVVYRVMRSSYHSSVSIGYAQEKTEEHPKNNHMGTRAHRPSHRYVGNPVPLYCGWVHAAPITHSELSIHLDTNVISKKEKIKIFFPSFHEVFEIISVVYTCIWSKDLMTL